MNLACTVIASPTKEGAAIPIDIPPRKFIVIEDRCVVSRYAFAPLRHIIISSEML
jgi:hypothetical protein